MRIIGGHDYYDGAGLGIDSDVIFLRKEEVFETRLFNLPGPIATADYLPRRDGAKKRLSFAQVLLGGDVYPAIIEQEKWFYTGKLDFYGKQVIHPDTSRWIYRLDDALEALASLNAIDARWNERHFKKRRDKIIAHFTQTKPQAWTDFIITHRLVTGIVVYKPEEQKDREADLVQGNIANLKDIEFYRCVDAATAHMRIASFISGVLPGTVETEELSDTSKLIKAGFDTVTSFRQSPGVKKPRRKSHA